MKQLLEEEKIQMSKGRPDKDGRLKRVYSPINLSPSKPSPTDRATSHPPWRLES
ncbi:MAG: hypothetical protein ACFFBD_17030 [Candidatus Hodarchaeota archaeon]